MKIVLIKIFKDQRFALERDEESGKYCISFPVFNGYAGIQNITK